MKLKTTLAALALCASITPARAQFDSTTTATAPKTREVVAGKHYEAGAFHRFVPGLLPSLATRGSRCRRHRFRGVGECEGPPRQRLCRLASWRTRGVRGLFSFPPGTGPAPVSMRNPDAKAMQPSEVAQHVADAIESEQFWILTHPVYDDFVRRRADGILDRTTVVEPQPL